MPDNTEQEMKLYRLASEIRRLSDSLSYFSTQKAAPHLDFALPDSEDVLEYIRGQLEIMLGWRDHLKQNQINGKN